MVIKSAGLSTLNGSCKLEKISLLYVSLYLYLLLRDKRENARVTVFLVR
jgi:hypothetical protein